ncbi:MAG: hypothetical protein JNM76_02810 [Betaproteobacteria bacterium]|nr:hypothetical protein [Betaproteobacteria bacterium]
MMRKSLLVLGVLLLLAGGAAWWFFSSLDHLVKGALEHYGPQVLGVSVAVGSVEISTKNGRGVVRDVLIGNPSGYSGTHALTVGEVTLALDASTLGSDVVVIREISVSAPSIQYELVGGTANLEVIQKNIERHLAEAGGGKNRGAGSADTGPGKARRYIIHAANIRNAQVRVSNPLLKGGSLDFTLPDLTLRRIGGDPSGGPGVTGGEAAGIITQALLVRIAAKALTSGQILERGVDGALDMLKEILKPRH